MNHDSDLGNVKFLRPIDKDGRVSHWNLEA
jgi:hypothetical protein